MPDPVKETPEKGDDKDLLGNFKAEVDRKIDSVKNALAQSTNELKQQLQALVPKEPKTPPSNSSKKTLKDLWWEDEDAAAEQIIDAAEKRIDKKLAANQRQAEVMGGLFQDFPELKNMQDPLTVKALEVYNTLPAQDKETPASYRLAVLEAAHMMGVAPMSKRKKEGNDDDWTSPGGNSAPRRSRKGDDELDPASLAFASAVGLNVDDPKVIERLKKSAGRRNWQKYQ